MQIKTILVPCDFSAHAEHAFKWALGMAEHWGAKIILFHAAPVAPRVSYPDAMFLLDLPKLEADLMADVEKRLREFVTKKGTSTVPVETRAVLGDPFWEICQAAEQEHADKPAKGEIAEDVEEQTLGREPLEEIEQHFSGPPRSRSWPALSE